jgi:hypothetical protein
MKLERTPTGRVELRLSKDPDQFSQLAEFVRKTLKGKWKQQADGLDQSYWDLDVDGKIVTVHREHYLGVSVICDEDEEKVHLLEKLMSALEVNVTAKKAV